MPLPAPFPLVPLRAFGPSALDADTAWLRAAVDCFEPRLREVEARPAGGAAAWTELPGIGCGWTCRCAGAGRRVVDLDAVLAEPASAEASARLSRRLAGAAARRRPAVLGASADPWGDAGRRTATRRLLERCRSAAPLDLVLVTASPLVLCDLDVLVELDHVHSLEVELALPTGDAALARRLAPSAPAPGEVVAALAELAAEGLAVRLRVTPLLPGLGAGAAVLRPLLAAAAAAGASDVAATPLPLPRGRVRRRFLAWLGAERPDLVAGTRRLYRRGAHLPAAERRALLADFDRLRLAHGFPRPHPGRG